MTGAVGTKWYTAQELEFCTGTGIVHRNQDCAQELEMVHRNWDVVQELGWRVEHRNLGGERVELSVTVVERRSRTCRLFVLSRSDQARQRQV